MSFIFLTTNEIAQVGGVQFVLFKKINKRLFIPNCTRKSWDYVLIIDMKKYETA